MLECFMMYTLFMHNLLQSMVQFTQLLAPHWRLNVQLWVDVKLEMLKLQEDIACLQNVSMSTFTNA